MKEQIKLRLQIWENEKVKIRKSQYKNHLINLKGDVLICDVVIQELKEILKENENN